MDNIRRELGKSIYILCRYIAWTAEMQSKRLGHFQRLATMEGENLVDFMNDALIIRNVV